MNLRPYLKKLDPDVKEKIDQAIKEGAPFVDVGLTDFHAAVLKKKGWGVEVLRSFTTHQRGMFTTYRLHNLRWHERFAEKYMTNLLIIIGIVVSALGVAIQCSQATSTSAKPAELEERLGAPYSN